MGDRKFFLWVVLMLFIPHISLALVLSDHNPTYVGIQYKPARQHISKLLIQDSSPIDILGIFALKKDLFSDILTSIKTNSNFTMKYNPHYENNLLGFSGVFGYYYNKNLRIESEVSGEVFHLNNDDYKIADLAKYFAIAYHIDQNNYYPQSNEYAVLINSGVEATSALINVCYDVDALKYNITAYSCLGFGVDIIDFLNTYFTKFSYQGKLGVSYPISSKISIFAEGYYHGLFGQKFENILEYHTCDQHHDHKVLATAMLSIRYYGGSLGVKFVL
ncbi:MULTISPECIES: P44/Msp2 family outer membrane protein [Ehrlichia]|uniref:Surface antigen family protein n=1 Tax=Ehrlichia cf. muris str. EmCRT TaxID=1359167 RepID=A0A0F3N6Z4_9RICK|nr:MULTISPECIES: P44/Msp2 family outer membrane protein [Ehrlichia]KJV63472.1 surface antigen family protein [Ehrlichia cf. muris str. EmCRT]OUC04490.1 hypothetical protein DB91_01720 [Ehrlichia sp. Wisconsin_h]